ncbi:MAG: hypothetical protein LBM66_02435 [Bifidobacteriaceae bacterium]|nr:hypothetical protein [Bifidobacteriaceae bacterium]
MDPEAQAQRIVEEAQLAGEADLPQRVAAFEQAHRALQDLLASGAE